MCCFLANTKKLKGCYFYHRPENSSKDCLMREEYVNEALNGRVLRIILDDVKGGSKLLFLLLLFSLVQ